MSDVRAPLSERIARAREEKWWKKVSESKDVSLSSTTCLYCGSEEHHWDGGETRPLSDAAYVDLDTYVVQ